MQLDHAFSTIDNGPIYKETLYGRWPVEPYNTATTLFFLAFVVYWMWKIRGTRGENLLISVTLPIIGLGFVGGFLYHSFRNHVAWLLLDWVPIVITAQVVAIYFWRTYLKSWWASTICALIPMLLTILLSQLIGTNNSLMSLSYLILAISVLAPIIGFVMREPKTGLWPLAAAILCVVAAITLRTLDRNSLMDFLPMGSHFLWHTFGALTCHFLILYIYNKKPQLRI